LFFEEKRRIVIEALKGTVRSFKPQPLLKIFHEQYMVIRSRYILLSSTEAAVQAKLFGRNASQGTPTRSTI